MILLNLKFIPSRAGKSLKSVYKVQVATITGRCTRGKPLTLMKPFPYNEKRYTGFHRITDNTMVRMSEENAKIIVIDGPIGVGKSAFAKALAEEFDMHYIPQPTMDQTYLLPSGYDLRQHDHELPKALRSYDHKNFCVDPKNPGAALFQFTMLFHRFQQYIDALAHLLNTGQGVILERCYFGDYVFMKAMYDHDFVSREAYVNYFEVIKNTEIFLKFPHLIIYLDIPVPVVQERIRTRNLSYEQNSPALSKKYLENLEKYWKQDYLQKLSPFSEILVYDWSDGGDIEIVADDIERIDFDACRLDNKFQHWKISRQGLFKMRTLFTNDRFSLNKYFYFPYWNVPEFSTPNDVLLEKDKVLSKIPECKYDIGYNYLMGDSIWKILFRSKMFQHRRNKSYLFYHPEQD